ncbi:hypothetical protein HK101_011211 [Irineochytrium annulatum]|nr:hypothetical protein HK101_011211 [Irineochytrium annulatum]
MYASAILLALFSSSVVAEYQYGAPAPASSAAPAVTKPAYGDHPASSAAPEKTVTKPAYVHSSAAPAKTPEYVSPSSSRAPEKTATAPAYQYGAPSSSAAPAKTPAYSSAAPAKSATTRAYVNSSKAPQVTSTPKYEPECEGEPTSTKAPQVTATPAYLASTRAPVATNVLYSGTGSVAPSALVAGAVAVAALFL